MPAGYALASRRLMRPLLRPQMATTWQAEPTCSTRACTIFSIAPIPSPPPVMPDSHQPSMRRTHIKIGCADLRNAVTFTHSQKSHGRWDTELGTCMCCTTHAELLGGHLRGHIILMKHVASAQQVQGIVQKRCCCLSCVC